MEFRPRSGPRRPYKFRKKLMGFLATSATFVAAAAHGQEQGSELTDQEKNALNTHLVMDAQLDFNAMSRLAETSYSKTLDSLQTSLNGYVREKHADAAWGVTVVDQQKVDLGRALGFSTGGVLRQLNATPYDVSAHVVDYANIYMGQPYSSDYGTHGYALLPGTARDEYTLNPGAVFVFPGSFHTISREYNIPGLTKSQMLEFSYRHEGVHGVEGHFLGQSMDLEALQKEKRDSVRTSFNKPCITKDFMMRYRSEVYADVAALGQMIRRGEDLSLIRAVADWRATAAQLRPSDREHLSTPVLRAFKKHLSRMGLREFRALDENAAEKLYIDMVETYGMTAESFRILETYERTLKGEQGTDAADIDKIRDLARHNGDAKKALEFNTFFNSTAHKMPEPPTPEMKKAVHYGLSAWDPLKELQDKAFAEGHKITPATITKAYGIMNDELIKLTKKDPDRADLYQEKMTYLQRVFISNLKSMDYADLNNRYGVSLSDLRNLP